MTRAESQAPLINETDTKWRYEEALWKLSEQVLRRNQILLRLNTLTALPLGFAPAMGIVGQFDTGQARKLLALIDQQTSKINDALAEANHWGAQCGIAPVEWRSVPGFRSELDGI